MDKSKGKEINGVGIKPDVEVKLDPAFTTGAPKLKDGESYAPDSANPAAQSVQVYLKFLGYEVDRSDAYSLNKVEKHKTIPERSMV